MNLPSLLTLKIVLLLYYLPPTKAIYIGDPSAYHNASFNLEDYLSPFHDDPPSHHHSRRWDTPPAADDDVWQRAICKGRNLLNAIRETDQQAAGRYQPPPPGMTVQSRFTKYPRMFVTVA
jgi:hypothetical protein